MERGTMRQGIDVSFYQARYDNKTRKYITLDWDKAAAAGARFAMVRLTSCEYNLLGRRMWMIVDALAGAHTQGALDRGLETNGYSLLDYTGKYAPAYQAKVAFSLAPGLRWYFADFEQKYLWWPGLPSRSRCLAILEEWREAMIGLVGLGRLGWYGNLSLWRKLQPLPDWLAEMPFWFAGPSFGSVPADVRCRWWQYSWKGSGSEYGCGSKSVDLDKEV